MFSGIVESTVEVQSVLAEPGLVRVTLQRPTILTIFPVVILLPSMVCA